MPTSRPPHPASAAAIAAALAALSLVLAACRDPGPGSEEGSEEGSSVAAEPVPSSYLGSYTLHDDEFGTSVTVVVAGETRTIDANSLPNHETGDFPNGGNPNEISAQDLHYEFPTEPAPTGQPSFAQTPGVGVNGVPFEPGTAETVSCGSGESYRIEALQDLYDLGLDMNNAHVQPGGKYHYHGASQLLVDAFATDGDLVHIGFAADGFLIYYSKSGAYRPGYRVATEPRTGTGCTYRGQTVDIDGTVPDGTYVSDWVHAEEVGDLDECNGITVDGQYLYLLTADYPYVPRCLMGEFTDPGPRP